MSTVNEIELDADGVLRSEQAWALHSLGRKSWNAFMKDNAEAKVDFYEFDFARKCKGQTIDFSEFSFPQGANFELSVFGDRNVNFSGANFGDGDVNFSGTNFGEGSLEFSGAQFGDGEVNFSEASFYCKDVSFYDAAFGNGDVDFRRAQFAGCISVNFDNVQFGAGDVIFMAARFKGGCVTFGGAGFGNGNVDFERTCFDDSDVSFAGARFGDGEVIFTEASFGDGEVSFSRANLGGGDLMFTDASFGNGSIYLDGIRCNQLDFRCKKIGDMDRFDHETSKDVTFRELTNNLEFNMDMAQVDNVCLFTNVDFRGFAQVSFRGSAFGGLLDLNGCRFAYVPDFTSTSISNHLSVDHLMIVKQACYKPGDSTKARRLKELAKKAEDRRTELNMLALELTAMSATKEIPFMSRQLNALYSWLSNYGRSIFRPFAVLLVTLVIAAFAYGAISYTQPKNQLPPTVQQRTVDSIQLAVSQSFPFLSWSRTVKNTSISALYGDAANINNYPFLETIGLIQSFVSYLSLFFIGLGIRNRFKL